MPPYLILENVRDACLTVKLLGNGKEKTVASGTAFAFYAKAHLALIKQCTTLF